MPLTSFPMNSSGGSAAGSDPLAAGALGPGAKGSMAAFFAAMPGGAGIQAGAPAAGVDPAQPASFAQFMAAPGKGQASPVSPGPASTGFLFPETGRLTAAAGTANKWDGPAGGSQGELAAPGGGAAAAFLSGGDPPQQSGLRGSAPGVSKASVQPAGKRLCAGARGGQRAAMQTLAETGSSSVRLKGTPTPKATHEARSSSNGSGGDSAATVNPDGPSLPDPTPGNVTSKAADGATAGTAGVLSNGETPAIPVTVETPARSATALSTPVGRLDSGSVSGSAMDSKACCSAQTAGIRPSANGSPAESARLPHGRETLAHSAADEAPPRSGAGETRDSESARLSKDDEPPAQSGADETPPPSPAKARARAIDAARTAVIPATVAAGAEKIAALSAPPPRVKGANGQNSDKITLDNDLKYDIKYDTALGTTGARPTSTMTAQNFARSFAAFGAGVAISGAAAGVGIKGNPPAADSSAPASTAREAVAAVVRIADTQAGRADVPAHVVNMSFKIGGEDLSVRVELRGTEVRTQFSTSSAELRAALSGEWQGAAPGGGSHNLTFSDPEFAQSSSSSNGSLTEGGAGYRRRDGDGGTDAFGRTSSPPDAAGLESVEAAPSPVLTPLGASAHLRAFA